MINVTNTPNPETKKLNIDFEISDGSKEFTPDDHGGIKLVKDLFGLNNLELIFIDKDFISIKKKKESDWANILPDILNVVRQSINKEMKKFFFKNNNNFKDEISIRIQQVLDEKIRPAVAMDGGDIQLKNYKDGVAEVLLKGACAGCPSSTITLKHGVERMIKHYVPEVNSVEALNFDEK
tara:strand:+ start:270 stop:809 length:540 start_codon:yes stop_codon:yes gene_type:complete